MGVNDEVVLRSRATKSCDEKLPGPTRAVGASGMTVTMTLSSGEAAAGGACRGGCAVCAVISKVSMLVRAVCAE